MKKNILISFILVFVLTNTSIAQEVKQLTPFDKITLSPHVEAILTKSDKESITIVSSTVSNDKIHIQVKNNILRVYLEGAKEYTKNEKVNENGKETKKSIYTGTVLKVIISYKTLETLSIRGAETIQMNSKLDQDTFDLAIYGESDVILNDVKLNSMKTAIYGESNLIFNSGIIKEQKLTIYGEAKVNALAINNNITRATLYGKAMVRLNTSDLIKITAFGEARVSYNGNPEIQKGITIGKAEITKIE